MDSPNEQIVPTVQIKRDLKLKLLLSIYHTLITVCDAAY